VALWRNFTKSLNVQREKLLILDEVVYFKTVRRAATGASNDKMRHSSFSGEDNELLRQKSGEPFEGTVEKRSFLYYHHSPAVQEVS